MGGKNGTKVLSAFPGTLCGGQARPGAIGKKRGQKVNIFDFDGSKPSLIFEFDLKKGQGDFKRSTNNYDATFTVTDSDFEKVSEHLKQKNRINARKK